MAFATIGTKGIEDAAIATADIADNAVTSAKTSGIPARPNAQPLIINGDMGVWQRSTSTVTMSDGYYNVDRYRGENNVASSAATWSRSTSVPDDTGLAYSLQVDCTTADASIAASEQCGIQQTIEAQDLQLLKWGTSDAEALTVAFWCKSNQTGQHSVSLRKLDNTNYCQPKTYTISSANTWEKKVLTFSALTLSGGAIANDNGDGLQIHWKLSAGSNYQGTADTWTATNQGATAVSGDVNFLSSTSNNFFLTGVQIEVGSYTAATIPPFQNETYANNLMRCQRYYYFHVSETENGGTDTTISLTSQYNSSSMKGFISFPTRMRTKPTLKQNTGSNMYRVYENGSNATMTSLTLSTETTYNTAVFTAGSTVSVTAGSCGTLQTMDGTAFVAFDSEL